MNRREFCAVCAVLAVGPSEAPKSDPFYVEARFKDGKLLGYWYYDKWAGRMMKLGGRLFIAAGKEIKMIHTSWNGESLYGSSQKSWSWTPNKDVMFTGELKNLRGKRCHSDLRRNSMYLGGVLWWAGEKP